MIIDAKDLVLGRVSSRIAKKLLEGEEIIVVNSNQAVISGEDKSTLNEYDAWTKIRSLVDPTQGPFQLKGPGDLVRQTVKGMLPMKKEKGKLAYRRLEAYPDVPSRFDGEELETFPKADVKELSTRRFIRLGELSKHLKEGK